MVDRCWVEYRFLMIFFFLIFLVDVYYSHLFYALVAVGG